MTANGLTDLIHFFEVIHLPVDSIPLQNPPTAEAPVDTDSQVESSFQFGTDIRLELTRTYSISQEVAEGLNRVSFWRGESKSALVNLALMELLIKYPELQLSIPTIKKQ